MGAAAGPRGRFGSRRKWLRSCPPSYLFALGRIRLGPDACQSSQAAASTGIFRISPMKIITSSPESMYYAPVYPGVEAVSAAHSINASTWTSSRPRADSVCTSSVGSARAAAQRRHSSSRESSIHASLRPAA